MTKGYLASAASRENAVVCVPEVGGKQIEIAQSFRETMLDSSFVFYG